MGDYCSRRRAGRRPSQITTLPLRHFPIRIPGESQNTKFKRGRCAHCKESHSRKDSTWFCRECELWLCHSGDPREDCFLKWHTGRELRDLKCYIPRQKSVDLLSPGLELTLDYLCTNIYHMHLSIVLTAYKMLSDFLIHGS